MCMKMAKIYAAMYGRAFGTFLMHSTLGNFPTLRIVVARPVLRAEGTSVHIHVWDSTLYIAPRQMFVLLATSLRAQCIAPLPGGMVGSVGDT